MKIWLQVISSSFLELAIRIKITPMCHATIIIFLLVVHLCTEKPPIYRDRITYKSIRKINSWLVCRRIEQYFHFDWEKQSLNLVRSIRCCRDFLLLLVNSSLFLSRIVHVGSSHYLYILIIGAFRKSRDLNKAYLGLSWITFVITSQ